MSLDQRGDLEEMVAIMKPAELDEYLRLLQRENDAEGVLFWTRKTMRAMRARARARHKRQEAKKAGILATE